MADKEEELELVEEAPPPTEQLKPKKLPRLAPEGIRTFTVARQYDESGVSGEGVVIEGVTLAIFDSMNDFIKVHILPHPSNRTIITYDDGEQERFGLFNEEEKTDEEKDIN